MLLDQNERDGEGEAAVNTIRHTHIQRLGDAVYDSNESASFYRWLWARRIFRLYIGVSTSYRERRMGFYCVRFCS